MSNNTRFTDEELIAYLDGESDFSPISEIEKDLVNNPDLRVRLESLALEKDKLKQSLESILDLAPEPPTFEDLITDTQKFGFGHLIAVATIALVIGFGLATYLIRDGEDQWRDYVAAYQALYANSTLSHIDQASTDASKELDRVGSAIGKKLDLTTVSKPKQLDYKRAQILSFKGQPLVQLAYLSKIGVPIALCIIQSSNSSDSGLKHQNMQGMSAVHWTKDGFEYLLIGGKDVELIERSAVYFSKHL